ncbi:MAG TPA: response regulator, partial [Candidatus Brocadiia bacterium]|nr:response regulator [Candidatus Brocadiia bacterium]
HGGMINVYSEEGRGSTFKIYLPMVERRAAVVGAKVEARPQGGSETILVAEDDEAVRNLTALLLRRSGYRVLLAANGEEACSVFEQHAAEVDLVLMDVVMPRLGGREASERIRAACPGVRVLFTSGYTENVVHTNFVIKEGVRLLRKPYGPDELLRKVREALEG